MPHIVFAVAHLLCPWPGCGLPIAMIDFRLEQMNDPELYARGVGDWFRGHDFGLVGRCPRCGHGVLFGRGEKRTVEDIEATDYPRLPDEWYKFALVRETYE
jgi:hypothetical protein